MERQYYAINCALLCWLLGLLSWFGNATQMALFFAALTVSAFIIHIQRSQVNTMFKKKKAVEFNQTAASTPVPVAEKETTEVKKQESTTLASGVRFEGNITSSGHVYVYGTLVGNIEAKDSLIKIMRGGLVEGDINCRELIIDGNVIGRFHSNAIEICENGKITGTIAYQTLSIKKGGTFTGTAEVLPKVVEQSNIFDLLGDKSQNNSGAVVAEEEAKEAVTG